MAGGTVLLAIFGLVALLAGGCEIIRAVDRWNQRRKVARWIDLGLVDGPGARRARHEPEVENLRRSGSL